MTAIQGTTEIVYRYQRRSKHLERGRPSGGGNIASPGHCEKWPDCKEDGVGGLKIKEGASESEPLTSHDSDEERKVALY
jgi:hypothetical protein